MAQDKMTLEDWLDDLCVRFIINLPREDLSSVARICFQIEEAQWFYEDFIRPLDPALPSMSLRSFSLKMFQHCPLLASFSAESHIKAFEEFMQYKTRVPVRGAIMLNDNMDAAVLVRGYKKGAGWSFPRGKINKDEDDLDCAIREVYEETGYDLREAGLVDRNAPVHPLEVTMHDQQVRLYVFRGIPEDTIFETRTRKEIGGIRWYKVEELPAYRKRKGAGKVNGPGGPSSEKFYMVAPFMVQLRQWVLKQKKLDAQKVGDSTTHHHPQVYEDNLTDDNVVHEPVHAPTAPGSHPEFIDSATKELQRLLKVRPPTQGLQILSPTADQQAGQALLSLLQPKIAGGGQLSGQSQVGASYTPSGHTLAELPEAPTLYHPQERQVPVSGYEASHQFLGGINPNTGYAQRHRPRPYVDVTTELPNPPTFSEQPHQSQTQPIQLVHPQPLPPQVQKAMLLRDMSSSPQIAEHATSRPGPSGLPREPRHAQYAMHSTQAHQSIQGVPPEKILPSQLAAHPAHLLSVLKGNTSPADTSRRPKPESPRQPMNVVADYNHQRQFLAQGNEYTGQHDTPAMPYGVNPPRVNSSQAAPSSTDPRPIPPTDKHRAGLLDMFKKSEASLSQSQLDGEGATRRTSHVGEGEKQPQWTGQPSPSMANAVRSAAHEDRQTIQMNPEANLPFRALTILPRPKPGQPSGENATTSVRTTIDMNRQSTRGSQSSRKSSFNKVSPSFVNASPRLPQLPPQKIQQLGQSSPRSYPDSIQSYPYGTSQGSQPNPLSLFPGPPSASALPIPGGVQFQQNSTAEQKNTLLSLFGKPKSTLEQSKGKEPALPDQIAPGTAPRSRLGSVASSRGEAMSGLQGNASRRGSQTPISPADRSFLLNFLENAGSNARR
ncbi:hypothetical protein GGS26DRAFT_540712 [Hypomontagnella submonticulosa]|nr:hypothetical protein GGS26DRAFT_540712 [Hypomontagnella submonticulosa]